ncbi:MAG: DNA-binding transcriptional regulator [Kiritimatiellae bacterium]|nr:DNA-binding transcriptional regulator [Kiritimatiellia bacterium]MDD5523113.1 DNA-binding transcriptional regulator [Kiritimatiellia bacterium]
MPKIFTQVPRVVVILETCVQPDRQKLDGLLKYVRFYGPWHLHIIQNRVGEQRLAHFEAWNANGIIVGQSMFDMEKLLARTKVPLVLIDPLPRHLAPGSPFSRFSTVRNDAVSVGVMAADYFLKQGFRNFAYVGEVLDRLWSRGRGQGFADRLRKTGFTCRIYPSLTRQEINDWSVEQAKLTRWLAALPKPVALFAAMDIRARQVLDTCLINGIKVPDEVAILGVDNDEQLCLGSYPTLSSIECDMGQCGFMAAQLLDEQMRVKRRRKTDLTYGVKKIVVRQSTHAVLPVQDRLIARALEFIQLNACEGIGVKDVVAYLKVSRRLAEIRFRKTCRHSILDEIQNVRLERVKRLMTETDFSIREITDRSGYQTDDHLRRMFKRHFGMTMQEYRRNVGI